MDRINGLNTVDIGSGRRGFRKKNKAAGIAGTEVTEVWCNDVQEEILTPIEQSGQTPTAGNRGQLWQAIRGTSSLVTPGWVRLPGGLIIQWGTFSGTTGALSNGVAEVTGVAVTFPRAFTVTCFLVLATARDVSGAGLQELAWGLAASPTGFSGGLSCRQASAAMTADYLAVGY